MAGYDVPLGEPMAASSVVRLPVPEGGSRTERAEHHLRRAVDLSYPLYTYNELKRILRCEYHRLVTELRSTRSWSEISLITGMTRAGLNKLGEELPPRTAHNGVRALLAILQDAGTAGLPLPKLAAAYYERCQMLDEGPSFEEALRALVDSGEVRAAEGRYSATGSYTQVTDPTLADGIEATVGQIADAAREEGPGGVAQLHRISFRAPADPERQREVLLAIKRAVCKVAVETEEALDGDERWLTVVVAGAPDLL
jgi:hypothetical protein